MLRAPRHASTPHLHLGVLCALTASLLAPADAIAALRSDRPTSARGFVLRWSDTPRARYHEIHVDGAMAARTTRTRWRDRTTRADGPHRYCVWSVLRPARRSLVGCLVLRTDAVRPGQPAMPYSATPSRSPVVLRWRRGSDAGSGLRQWIVYRNGIRIGTTSVPRIVDTDAPDGVHRYRTVAIDRAGNRSRQSPSTIVLVDSTTPAPPAATTAHPATAASPTLGWTTTADGGAPVATWLVRRNGVLVATTHAASFVDHAAPDGAHEYTVVAVDDAGNESAPSTPVAIRRDSTAPGAPTSLVATPGAASATLAWTPSSSEDVVAQRVLVRIDPAADSPWTVAASIGPQDTGWAATGIPLDSLHEYSIEAVDDLGNATRAERSDAVLLRAPEPAPAAPTGAVHLGQVGRPASVAMRDGGASVPLGDDVLWTFGDTIFTPAAEDGATIRANTGGIADPATPLAITEPLDANGAPRQLIPFNEDDLAFNAAQASPQDRVALWPTSGVVRSPTTSMLYYADLTIVAGAYGIRGVGTATIGVGDTEAVRTPGRLFHAPAEPLFGHAAVARNGSTYAYGCGQDAPLTFRCRLARVQTGQEHVRSAYEFWDGARWSGDVSDAEPVITGPTSGFTVSWNEYLQRYVAVYSPVFNNGVFMRVARRPEGPWSPQVKLFDGLAPAPGRYDYAGREHPELASMGGKVLNVTYYRPAALWVGEMHDVQVTLP